MNEEQEKEILNEAKIQTARHKKKIQIISLVAIIAVIAMATVACIPLIKALHSKAGIAALERKLDNYSGIVGVLIFTFIQALQVVIAVIPPIQVVGGVLFGWFWGGLLSFLGTLLGTMAIFVLVKKFGRPIVEAFVDEKQLKKFKFLQNEKKLTVILIILYLIPGIPKDVISYIVPLDSHKQEGFFLLCHALQTSSYNALHDFGKQCKKRQLHSCTCGAWSSSSSRYRWLFVQRCYSE